MLRLSQQEPVELALLAPLSELCEFLSHEEQLLARMPGHKCIARLQVRIFIESKPRHLVEHGAFQMHHLIVGENKDVVLAVRIGTCKCHHVVGILSEIRIQLHVLCKIMHPAHVPLQAEAQSVVFRRTGHLRPCRGLFRDHHRALVPAKDNGVQMFEELDRFQVLISAVFIGHPLAVLLAVVQVKHRSHRVHTQSVHMEMLDPEQRIGDQEVLHFRLAVVKDLRAPVRMLAHSRIRVFKGRRAVEVRQAVRVSREMRRYPVKDHTDIVAVQFIDQISKVFRRAVA